jgi:hypothetical protein
MTPFGVTATARPSAVDTRGGAAACARLRRSLVTRVTAADTRDSRAYPFVSLRRAAVVQRNPGEPDRQYDPDAVFGRQFALGCLVLFIAFLLLTASVWWFWTH